MGFDLKIPNELSPKELWRLVEKKSGLCSFKLRVVDGDELKKSDEIKLQDGTRLVMYERKQVSNERGRELRLLRRAQKTTRKTLKAAIGGVGDKVDGCKESIDT